jgi:hypothetical protein
MINSKKKGSRTMKYVIFISVLMFIIGYIYGGSKQEIKLKLVDINQQKEFISLKSYLKDIKNIDLDSLILEYESKRYLKGAVPLYGKNEVVTSFINYLTKIGR